MANPSKVKGDRWERAVLAYLQTFVDTRLARTKAGAQHDVGDIAGDPVIAYECRDRKRINYAQSLRDARAHADAASKPIGIAIIKQAQKPVGGALVIMTLDDFTKLRNLAS